MTGSTHGQLCIPSSFPNSYWMQTGFLFHPQNSDGRTVWTDTVESCGSITTSVAYVDGAQYRFSIWTSTTSSKWTAAVLKLDDGQAFATSRSGQNSFTMKTNDWHTTVWLENASHFTTWDNQFTSDPWAQAWLRKPNNISWNQWDADTQDVRDCDGVHPDNVISGSLSNGGTATWSATVMADNWPAC